MKTVSKALRLRLVSLAALVPMLLDAGQPPIRLFTIEDGLVRNWVQQIRVDSRGFLWFCTVEGLSIFDGSKFTNFTVRDGLPNRLVTDVVESWDGDYWIGTANGVARFHAAAVADRRVFESFRVSASNSANQIHALLEDSQHRLWLGTEEGLYCARASGSTLSFDLLPLQPGRQLPVWALAEDGQHRIWAGTPTDLYVHLPDGRSSRFESPSKVPSAVRALVLDEKGRLWLGGEGLAAIDTNPSQPAVVVRYPRLNGKRLDVSAMRRDRANGDIWIGRFGLIRFRPDAPAGKRFESFRVSPIPGQNEIDAVGFDAAGDLWAGVSTLGTIRVSQHRGEIFTEADGLESSVVVGMMEDRRGRFYAITGALHTLNELVDGRFQPKPRRQPADLDNMGWGQGSVVLQDSRDEWWAASARGLLHYRAAADPSQLAAMQPAVYTRRDGLPDDVILRLFEDSRGDLWAGTETGLARRDAKSGAWAVLLSQPGASVHSIAEDRSGNVWAGTASHRLLRVRGSSMDEIAEGLPAGYINALLADHAGRLWIGSSQGGLGRIDDPAAARPHVVQIEIDQGLASNHIFSLAEDRFGSIYIAGGQGVERLDSQTGNIHRLSGNKALLPGEIERLYRDRKGDLWFASNFGLARYDATPDPVPSPPRPLLRRLRVGEHEYPLPPLGVRQLDGLEFGPEETAIEIDYRPIYFDAFEQIRLQYRLVGASDTWSPAVETQSVRFAHLAPGTYVFEARSVGEDGGVSVPAILRFRLLPPMWRRRWFLSVSTCATIAGIFLLHRYRLQQVLAVERIRTRLATDLHDDLGAGLAEIAILSEVGRRSPAKADDSLERVAKRARALRSILSDIIWMVDPRNDRLPDLVHRMRETALNMLEAEGRTVRFTAPEEYTLQNTELPPDLRRHLMLFFKEAVTNAAKHAAANTIDLSLSLENGDLLLSVRDDGRGFEVRAASAGRGLPSMRFRAAEMHGTVRIDSSAGRGTEILLRIPLRKNPRADPPAFCGNAPRTPLG